jgi:hypothetical protein
MVENMKSQITPLFNEWLTLMEKAYEQLSKDDFLKLEDKIKEEIAFHRKNKPKREQYSGNFS